MRNEMISDFIIEKAKRFLLILMTKLLVLISMAQSTLYIHQKKHFWVYLKMIVQL